MMMDEDQLSIDALPDEILLNIFRTLSANEFVMCIPLVCEKWSQIIASDSCTLQRIGMLHVGLFIDYFYFGDERDMFHYPQLRFEQIIRMFRRSRYEYAFRDCSTKVKLNNDVVNTSTRYAEICKHITTLMISGDMRMFATHGLPYTDRLTTLVFFSIRFYNQYQHTLAEMGDVRDAMYVECSVGSSFDLKFLHSGFRRLRRFRADIKSLDINFLDDLLHTHRQTLETVDLRDFKVTGDLQWINVLSQRLRGRTINRLTMRSPYFTAKRVKQFMTTADLILPDDKSNVIIDNIQIGSRNEFFINIDPIII